MRRDTDGSPRPSGLSRRRLLAGIGGVGAVGMASGLGTGAYLADRETFSRNTFGAGTVELLVNGAGTDGTVDVDVSGIDRGDSGSERFDVGARTNPVRVWIATECVPSDALSRALEVDLRAGNASLTGGYRPLADVRADLLTGERIDDGCLDPEDTIPVDVYWRLPADAPDAAANSSTSLTFLLYAEQCRHVDEPNAVGPASLDEASAASSNPFAGRVCDEAEDCPECVEFGKANFGGSTAPGDILPLEMLLGGAGKHEIEITEVERKDDGEGGDGDVVGVAFALRDAEGNPGPDMCAVAVKGGPDRSPEPVEIDPISSETGAIVFAPLSLKNGKQYGVSNVTVSVCADAIDSGDEEPEATDCVVCDDEAVSLASLDVEYRGGADADVTVLAAGGNASGTLFDGTVAPGDDFTLLGSDVIRGGNGGGSSGGNGGSDKLGPEIEMTVDGGSPTRLHVSCSEPLPVGTRFGPGDAFEVAGGTTTTGEPLCGSEAN